MDTTGTLIMPPAGSTIASEVDWLFYLILYISIFFFVLVVGAATYFFIKYRRRGEIAPTSQVDHNIKLEIVWTVIPLAIVIILFFLGFSLYMRMNIAPKDALEVKVTAQRWLWTFDYPTGINSVNELVVPAGKPIKLLMSSNDVIHSFFVPDFRVKMDVLPNRYTSVWFNAPYPGQHNIQCSEYCGKGHSEMLGIVKVVSDREYTEWLESAAGPGEGIDLESYGEQLFTSKRCVTCHTVDGSLNVGPSFLHLFGENVYLQGGSQVRADENYLRESILAPEAKVVDGFEPVMPTYQGLLKPRDIDALIAYIKSLGQEQGEQQ
ncbi:MAG: cytochrome c oxidase subunit II [candidate division Zixibacteria bacterium RBG_16_53_22]|nr:MAG: cytochrome c oxidase subunit II [candidate division Zixibacteria bacterium RBG_16_53_22]